MREERSVVPGLSLGCSAGKDGCQGGRGILMGQRVSPLNGKIVAEVSVEREREGLKAH